MDLTVGNLAATTKNIRSNEDRITNLEITSGKNDIAVKALIDFKGKAFSTIESLKKELAQI